MAKTAENLRAAFAGESQATTTYLAFARRAEQEGHPQVAKLFRAAAMAETVHARNHLETMEAVKSTQDNLEEAIAGEKMEHKRMYPEFIEQAKREKEFEAVRTFEWARKVEMIHESLYKSALDALQDDGNTQVTEYFVCQVCGFTAEGEAPQKCPVCGSPQTKFFKVD